MRIFWLFLVLTVSLTLQGLFKIPYAPDFVLVFLAVTAVLASDQELIFFAFFGGLLQDSLYSFSFSATLIKTLVSWGMIIAKKNVELAPLRFAFWLVAISTPLMILGEILVFRLFYPMQVMTLDPFSIFLHIIWATILNLILTPLYFRIISRLIA